MRSALLHPVLGTAAFLALSACGSPEAATTASTSTPSRTTTSATTTSTPPGPTVRVKCDDDSSSSPLPLSSAGVPDFTTFWRRAAVTCTAQRSPNAATQHEVTALGKSAYSITPSESAALYALCAATSPTSSYGDATPIASPDHMARVSAVLLMCPGHPHAPVWRVKIEQFQAEETRQREQADAEEARQREQADAEARRDDELRASGRLFGSGVYRVGVEVQPGTYAIEGDISDCYWERLDASGEIIDNNFVSAAKRVQVTIRASDYSFSSERCGEWRPVG